MTLKIGCAMTILFFMVFLIPRLKQRKNWKILYVQSANFQKTPNSIERAQGVFQANKSRLIIVKFWSFNVREKVLALRPSLGSNSVSVCEDFCLETRQEKTTVFPRYKKIAFSNYRFYPSSLWSQPKCMHFEPNYSKCIGGRPRLLRKPRCWKHASLHAGAQRPSRSLLLLHRGKQQTGKMSNKEMKQTGDGGQSTASDAGR